MPTEQQILGAKIRAEAEAFDLKHRKPWMRGGGWIVPSTQERNEHLSRVFGLHPREFSRYMTYSRYCTHKWSEGACDDCP